MRGKRALASAIFQILLRIANAYLLTDELFREKHLDAELPSRQDAFLSTQANGHFKALQSLEVEPAALALSNLQTPF